MTAYYKSTERQAAYLAECNRWLGTPFRAGSAIPGLDGGVDCVGLCAAIHSACGACSLSGMERLPLDWHLHHGNSAILQFLQEPAIRSRLQFIDPESGLFENGDLIAVKTALCVHHLGLFVRDACGSHLLHVPIRGTVQRWVLNAPPLTGKIAGAWRIQE